MMTLQQLAAAISQRAEGRYEVHVANAMDLPGVEQTSEILRLKRSCIDKAGWRTVLLIELQSSAVQEAHQWAADVRDVLPEPETSDLYMFLLISDVTNDAAMRIETDDRFCRKIVARQSEDVMDFLDRTFLAALDPPGNVETLSDPLVSALKSLSDDLPWTVPYISAWKTELLSNTSGADVVRALSDSLRSREDQR
ncbi:ABC-three component system middle component 1 [Salinicola endophyticus]|uniref:ABC-three component system middle component 1 n=1 Tax=Salinicola endophyticus TaxID=1949083 RepID=UPI000DA2642E|nr:ABC-three component system middle component 1 [Salinicola endophyticus]